MKVKDLATKFGKKPKDFIKLLGELDIVVKSPNTKLDDETVDIISDLLDSSKKETKTEETEVKQKHLH